MLEIRSQFHGRTETILLIWLDILLYFTAGVSLEMSFPSRTFLNFQFCLRFFALMHARSELLGHTSMSSALSSPSIANSFPSVPQETSRAYKTHTFGSLNVPTISTTFPTTHTYQKQFEHAVLLEVSMISTLIAIIVLSTLLFSDLLSRYRQHCRRDREHARIREHNSLDDIRNRNTILVVVEHLKTPFEVNV